MSRGDGEVGPPHEMVLAMNQVSGAEEWLCPKCGRRLLLRWPPNYEKLVLDPGDESAVHAGGKGGARIGRVTAEPIDNREQETTDRDWLRDHGIDWGEATA
jgi:hypothetical protein